MSDLSRAISRVFCLFDDRSGDIREKVARFRTDRGVIDRLSLGRFPRDDDEFVVRLEAPLSP